MRALKRLTSAKKGLALAMAAIMLPIFGVVMVFAIDLGLAQTAQTRLDRAVNHAASAAVLRLPDEVGASNLAKSMVRLSLADHGRFGDDLDVTVSIDGMVITVGASMTANAFFGALANQTSYDIAAQASRTLVP